VNQTVARAAPDAEKAKLIPVSDAELRAAHAKVQEQNRSLENLRAAMNAEQEKLRADRASFEQVRQNALSDIAAERDRLAAAAAAADAQKKQYEAELTKLSTQQQDLANSGQLTQEKKDELAQQRQKIQAEQANVNTQIDQLLQQQQQLARRETNLAQHEQELADRAKEQAALKDKLIGEGLQLAQWQKALQDWQADLQAASRQPAAASAAAPTPPADLTRRVEPRVHVVDPVAERSQTTLPTAEVQGVVVHNRPIKEVRYAVTTTEQPAEQFAANTPGTNYKGIRPERWKRVPLETRPVEPDAEGEVSQTFNFNVPLTRGFNRIVITATDVDGQEGAVERIVERRDDEAEVHIIAIGINGYDNKQQVPQLKYAVADAQAVAGALQKGLGVPQQNVKLLLDDEATKETIENWLGDQLPGRVGKGDTVVIFFSGHGAPEATPGVGGVEKYLLPVNADPSRCFSTGIAMKRIAEIFRRLPAERVLFVIDSCFSGAATGGGRGLESNLKGIRVTRVDRSLEATKRIVLTGSQGNQPSQEKDELQHGVFSYYLVKALQGAADRDGDKQVTVDEVFRYVSANVSTATDNRQTPVVSPELTAEPAAASVVMSYVK
jgi:hypothetical protein